MRNHFVIGHSGKLDQAAIEPEVALSALARLLLRRRQMRSTAKTDARIAPAALRLLLAFLSVGVLPQFSCSPDRHDRPSDAGPTTGGEVGAEGGTLLFEDGIKLVVPPGALNEPTSISIEALPASQGDAIISRTTTGDLRSKRFLAGVIAKPGGLTFAVPAQLVIPVAPLAPLSIPVPVTFDLTAGSYAYASSKLEYDGTTRELTLEVDHFSTAGSVTLSATAASEDLTDAEFAACMTCEGNAAPECESIDNLQNSCCLLPAEPSAGGCSRSADCVCCREGKIEVNSRASDISARDCQLLNDELRITFPDCGTSAIETSQWSESTCDDLELSMEVTPAALQLFLGTENEGDLRALVTGKRGEESYFQRAEVYPSWTSEQPEVVRVLDDSPGRVHADRLALSPVRVRASWSGTTALAQVEVSCRDCQFAVKASATSMMEGGTVSVTASMEDKQGHPVALESKRVEWTSSDPSVVSLSKSTGLTIQLTGLRVGKAVITATYPDLVQAPGPARREITVTQGATGIAGTASMP